MSDLTTRIAGLKTIKTGKEMRPELLFLLQTFASRISLIDTNLDAAGSLVIVEDRFDSLKELFVATLARYEDGEWFDEIVEPDPDAPPDEEVPG